jgi:tRNA threonylcarbamoyladenosine biosynthesis protein TsaB
MPAILAVETSTLTASVAILLDGTITVERESGVNSHAELLLPLIDECLKAAGLQLADLETIAVGAGPGSFTGLRIGMATVKGLCLASGRPLTPVSSLAALAHDFHAVAPNTLLVPVLDARRKEVYAGFFHRQDGILVPAGEEKVLAPEDLAELVAGYGAEQVLICGNGATKYQELIGPIAKLDLAGPQIPSAAAVAKLAQHIPASLNIASAAPTYVRLPDAQIKFPDGNPGGTFSAPTKTTKS